MSAGVRSARERIASGSSGTMAAATTTAASPWPARGASGRWRRRFDDRAVSPPAAKLVAGDDVLLVVARTTDTAATPTDERTPMSCGRSTRPAASSAAPAVTSSPRADVAYPPELRPWRKSSARRLPANSTGSTASAAGSGAPVASRHGVAQRPRRERSTGERSADNRQQPRSRWRSTGNASGNDRKTIHHRAVEAGHIDTTGDRPGQHTAGRFTTAGTVSASSRRS